MTAQVRPGAVLADKGYDSNAFLHSLKIRAITAERWFGKSGQVG